MKFNIKNYDLTMFIGILVFIGMIVFVARVDHNHRTELADQVEAIANDLGCSYIEQSWKNPNTFYIDCGDDEIRIVKMD